MWGRGELGAMLWMLIYIYSIISIHTTNSKELKAPSKPIMLMLNRLSCNGRYIRIFQRYIQLAHLYGMRSI